MADISKYKICTLASHSALQILKGAKDEGFETIAICQKGREGIYESYNVADKIITLDKFEDYFKIEEELVKDNAIIIPHGSFVSYLGHEKIESIKAMHYGNKKIIEWESDREKERKWLLDAKLNLPKIYKDPEEIDGPVIIKFHGAQGGKGYFIANNPQEYHERINESGNNDEHAIQEYIVGVPLYTHYFYSRLTDELEIMSFDKRYESNADSIGRISAKDQLDTNIRTSYTITGNIPLVVRESLLPILHEMGRNVIESSKKFVDGGLFGPFCLEAIIDPNLQFFVFEISARIVAGTNPFINGSPYTWLKYDVPMSTGRRIALDIKQAIQEDKLDMVLG
ncbi:formate--phosphoribosylaminoimidazolecarboxamide ligase [Patescibacteria group bacterium]|nr:formate--phosphoribosylaminoimidazolecarboxamide ligase [Patescibacteria group bacterium]